MTTAEKIETARQAADDGVRQRFNKGPGQAAQGSCAYEYWQQVFTATLVGLVELERAEKGAF